MFPPKSLESYLDNHNPHTIRTIFKYAEKSAILRAGTKVETG